MKLFNFLEQKSLLDIAQPYILSSQEINTRLGINLEDIEINYDDKMVRLVIIPPVWYQGNKNIVHGGLITTLFDTLSGVLATIVALHEGKAVLTQDLRIEFKKPMFIEQEYVLTAHIKETNQDNVTLSFMAKNTDEEIVSEGVAVFKKIKPHY